MRRSFLFMVVAAVFTAGLPVLAQEFLVPNDTRVIFDPSISAPEIFLLPREILKSFQEPSVGPSRSRAALDTQLKEAQDFFKEPFSNILVLRSLVDLWSSPELKKEFSVNWASLQAELETSTPQLSDQEKAVLVYGFSTINLQALRLSADENDRAIVDKLNKHFKENPARKKELIEVDPFYRQSISPVEVKVEETPTLAHVWTDAEKQSIQEKSLSSTGEVSDVETLAEIIKRTRNFKRTQIEREGWLRNFVKKEDDGSQTLTAATPISGAAIVILLAVFRYIQAQSKADNAKTNHPRSQESYEEQMRKNKPEAWNNWPATRVDGQIRFLIANPDKPISTEKNAVISPAFEEALFMARFQEKGLQAYQELVTKNYGAAYLPDMLIKIGELQKLGDERHRTFLENSKLAFEQIASGEMKVRSARALVLKNYFAQKGSTKVEASANESLQKALDAVVQVFPKEKRTAAINDHTKSQLGAPELTSGVRTWWQMFREKSALEKALSPEVTFFKRWAIAGARIPAGAQYSAMVPGSSANESALKMSCGRKLKQLLVATGFSGGVAGLGYGFSKLIMKPDPDLELAEEDRKAQELAAKHDLQKIPGVSELRESFYLSGFKSEIQSWADQANLEVVFSPMTAPADETGLGSQIYVLLKAKEVSTGLARIEERKEKAINGILIRYNLESEGTNAELANKFGMKPEFVPAKIFWKMDKLRELKGDFLDSKVVRVNGNSIQLDSESAKAAIARSK